MKLSLNKDLMGKTISNVIVVGCGILLLFILYNLGNIEKGFARGLDILAPFIYGFAFAYILAYPMRTIERKWLKFLDKYHKRGLKRAIAIFIVVIIALLILFITISIVLPQFAENIVIVLNKTPVYLEKAEKFIVDTAYRFDISEQFLQSSLGSWESIAQNISNMIKTMIPQMVDISIGLTTDIFDLVLSLIISVYLLAGKERFFAQIKKLLYAFMPDNYVQKIIEITIQCHHTFIDFLGGKIISSLLVGVISYLALSLMNMPYPLLIAFITCITNIIPFFGPFIGAVPSALIILVTDPTKVIWYLLFTLVLQQVEGNILEPKILSNSLGLSPFWILFAILLGGDLFGFLGMIVGVPIFAVVYSLFKGLVENRLIEKGLPGQTHEYSSQENPVDAQVSK